MTAPLDHAAAMKERPILFSAPMVRAILEGRKTQTRRIVKLPQNVDGIPHSWCPAPYGGYGLKGGFVPVNSTGGIATKAFHEHHVMCPHGQPGERLWVRETFCPDWCEKPIYKADGGSAIDAGYSREPKWKPSIFMPRWASRLTLEVTGVRVERLQEISGKDCIAEGVQKRTALDDGVPFNNISLWRETIEDFHKLWDSINAKRAPWESNPWVWVIEFKRLP